MSNNGGDQSRLTLYHSGAVDYFTNQRPSQRGSLTYLLNTV